MVWPQNHWNSSPTLASKPVATVSQFGLKTGGDDFSWFGLKTGGFGFFQFDL
jgi:hypothetical protein